MAKVRPPPHQDLPSREDATVSVRHRKLTDWYEHSAAAGVVRRLGDLDFLNLIVLFGASLLLSVLPCIILLSSLAGERIDDDIARHLGLNRTGTSVISSLFSRPASTFSAGVLVSLLLGLIGTVAVAGSVHGMYRKVFGGLPTSVKERLLRWTIWAVAMGGLALVDAWVSGPVARSGGPVLLGLVNFVGATVTFWWSMHFLLGGHKSWMELLRPALVTGFFWIGLGVFASLYLSSTVVSDSKQYGKVGIVFTLTTWFIAIGAVVALGAVIGAVWQERFESRRSLRGSGLPREPVQPP